MATRASRIAQFHKESWVIKFKQIDFFIFLCFEHFLPDLVPAHTFMLAAVVEYDEIFLNISITF